MYEYVYLDSRLGFNVDWKLFASLIYSLHLNFGSESMGYVLVAFSYCFTTICCWMIGAIQQLVMHSKELIVQFSNLIFGCNLKFFQVWILLSWNPYARRVKKKLLTIFTRTLMGRKIFTSWEFVIKTENKIFPRFKLRMESFRYVKE